MCPQGAGGRPAVAPLVMRTLQWSDVPADLTSIVERGCVQRFTVYGVDGKSAGTITTTQLVLSHKHPDDYKYIAATLDDIRRTHKPLSTRHRIITVQGETRDIVIIGERLHDDTGEVVGTQGFYLDVTPTNEARQESIGQALLEIAENRASIEQAKGVLMYIYGIGPAAAFDLLKWRSQEGNVKLRALAERVLADVLNLKHDKGAPLSRATFDELFLAAHQRVAANNA